MKSIFLLFFLPLFSTAQQLGGIVKDLSTGTGIPGAQLLNSEGLKVVTDANGAFMLEYRQLPFQLICSAPTYVTDTLVITSADALIVWLTPVSELGTVVVTASRRTQLLEEAPISMEVLKPALIDNKGISDLEQAVDQSPGAYAMDGQISIRGGSGFSYGAGSRVLLLWNGMPMLSGDAGDVKWNSIPIENAAQIEIIKGASSVLYGSGALNGIISLTERTPTVKPVFRAKVQTGIYDDAKRPGLNWRAKNPTFQLMDAYYGKLNPRFGYTLAVHGFLNKGYRDGETEARARISGSVLFRPEIRRLNAGIGYGLQYQKGGSFIIWQSDSLGYTPSGGSDTAQAGSSLSITRGIRLYLDPYVNYLDAGNNKHQLRTRIYYVDNANYTNLSQSSNATTYYGDYQFQKNWKRKFYLTAGATAHVSVVRSNLYGNHESRNYAAYVQGEKRWKKLQITAGVRLEYFQQDTLKQDSDFYFGADSMKIPVRPIFRTGLHYQVAAFTHLRASFGQGVRYPSVAERFTTTSVGNLLIFPNANLRPELGWAAETGIKQGIRIGNWKGFVDVAGFINEYSNMTEFTFGNYKPDSIPLSFTETDPGFIMKWLGFRAENAEKARIAGIEFSVNGTGKIRQVEVTALLGYTYMNPVSLNNDSTYRSTFSDTASNVLKYRFNHLAKADIEASWKGFSIGGSLRYNSFMKNIDRAFEEGIWGMQILEGLKEYRRIHNKATVVFDARIGYTFNDHYRVGFIVNNVLNTEYMGRPGDIQAPRSFIAQVQFKF